MYGPDRAGDQINQKNHNTAAPSTRRNFPGQSASRASKHVIYAAIASNIAIAICKLIAALATSSTAMLAEAVHSAVDTGNELLLLWGMKRSLRPPDFLHPYGHGKALYFYSLLVAVYIFGGGGVFAVLNGVSHFRHPDIDGSPTWNYVVLSLAALFEFYSWIISYRELRARKDRDESAWDEIIGSKDPTVITVFLEDSAGLLGAILALLGIFLGHILHKPYLDPAASILIGVLLSAVAFLLGRESGALLIGERTNRAKLTRIHNIICADPQVENVGDILTMQLAPDQVLLTANVRFKRSLDIEEIETAVERIKAEIRGQIPVIQQIFLEADSLANPLSQGAMHS